MPDFAGAASTWTGLDCFGSSLSLTSPSSWPVFVWHRQLAVLLLTLFQEIPEKKRRVASKIYLPTRRMGSERRTLSSLCSRCGRRYGVAWWSWSLLGRLRWGNLERKLNFRGRYRRRFGSNWQQFRPTTRRRAEAVTSRMAGGTTLERCVYSSTAQSTALRLIVLQHASPQRRRTSWRALAILGGFRLFVHSMDSIDFTALPRVQQPH